MISSATIFFLPILLLSSLTFAASQLTSPLLLPSTAPISSSDACNSTTDPIFCRSILPPRGTQPLYSYGIFSLTRSLSNSVKFLSIINPYLARRSALPAATAGALEDCQLLASLNIDFLTTVTAALNSTSVILLDPEAELFHTLLSAILTNQQTCLDGLIEADKANVAAGVLTPFLANGIKLYGLSLGLFVKAWSPNRKIRIASSQRNSGNLALLPIPMKEKHLLFHEVRASYDGRLPLKMSGKNRAVFEGRLGRGLLQASNSIQISELVVVSPDGTENFTTISDAVASAPNNTDGSDGYYLVLVRAGTYQEYVSVSKKKQYIMMIGDGINQTIVTGNRNVIDGSGTTTFNTATFAVVGKGFVAINMTFQNTAGPAKHQAVALRSGADLSSFYLCSFEGYQDTLYTHSLRQFYTQCDIYGTVDYIFGNAAVVFQNCNFYSRLPLTGQQNTITAQGRIDPNQNTGTSIQGGGFLAAADLAANIGSTSTYLGRPWKQYSRTMIMSVFMDELIQPTGWLPWNGDFALSTLYYAEYNNWGPGSNTSGRVTWPGYHILTNSTDALNFTVGSFISGDSWLPQTGVPYTSDML